jgi:nucleoid-associated protein YgaU
MGLISFIKDAGEKIFGKSKATVAAEAKEAAEQKAQKESQIVAFVNGLGLKVQNLAVSVEGDVAVVSGTTESQAEKEKVVLAVGNINGIGTVDDRITVKVPEPQAVYYTVQKGDSLSKIAKQHYGNAMKYPVIFEANKPMLKNPDLIYPGQVLRIPPLK